MTNSPVAPISSSTKPTRDGAAAFVRRLATAIQPPQGLPPALVLSTAAHTIGTGLVITLSAVYFTRIVGLTATQVGLGLTIAGGVAILAGLPFGRLSDHIGPRPLLICLLLGQAFAVILQTAVTSFPGYVACASLFAVATQASSAVRAALIARALPREGRVVGRGYLRAVTNVGFAMGSALAAVAFVSLQGAIFRLLLIVAALAFVVAALVVRGVPRGSRDRTAAPSHPLMALRDWRYTAVVAANALLQLHYAVLEVGIPIWVATQTDAPAWIISALMILNTVLIVVFQVPVGRRWGSLRQAGSIALVAGLSVATACTLLGVAGLTTGILTMLILIVAAVVHAAGELLHTNSSWAAGFGLAPDNAQGQYQGLFATGVAGAQAIGPVLLTAGVIALGTTGWFLAAAFFCIAGGLFWLATTLAQRLSRTVNATADAR